MTELTRLETIAGYEAALSRAAFLGTKRDVERQLALDDLFFLIVYVLGRNDVNRDWLFERCRMVQSDPNGYLDLWSREHYKDLADDTPILTHNRGWVSHGHLLVGDLVYDDYGRPRAVLALSTPYSDSACRRIRFSDGAEIVAGAGHLWRVRRKRNLRVGDWRIGARQISWEEEIVATDDLPPRADIGALREPICGEPQQLPVDPYLLGVWLGDGTTGQAAITAGFKDCEELAAILRSRGVEVRERWHSNAMTLRIGNGIRGQRDSSDFKNSLNKLGMLKEKRIPEIYHRASAHQRLMLLRGLMDTDGHCNTRGTATFTNTNDRLARGVYELAASLALRPRFREYRHQTGEYAGNRFFQISMQAHSDRSPFLLGRKAERAISPSAHRNCRDVVSVEIIPSVPTRCIQVEGGIYLAGREFIPTHNSTIITFAKTIQDVLADPELRVGIFSFTRPIAKAFLRQIKFEFETNQRLFDLFPDRLWEKPEREAPKWSEDDGIVLQRKGNPKELTIEAWGLVDAQPTSKHFSLMVYDDVVTMDSVSTPDMVNKVIDAWATSLNLTSEGGITRMIGTRWGHADPYAEIMRRDAVKPRYFPATDNGEFDGEPVLWDREYLETKIRTMGRYVAGCQLMQNPTADRKQGFLDEWLRYYPNRGDFGTFNKYILVDPASEKKKTSDFTAMVVIGLAPDENYYLLDGIRDRLNLRERGDALFSLHRRWRPKGVGYEKYGLQADVEYIKIRQADENYRFDITELGGRVSKRDRIRAMVPIFEAGRFWLPETLIKVDYEGRHVDLVTSFVQEEYKPFPVGLHDDFFDAIARIGDPEMNVVWPKARLEEDRYARSRRRERRYSAWAA